jgi:multidrug efflux pump subunit AcrA (membrane-fusion protein)
MFKTIRIVSLLISIACLAGCQKSQVTDPQSEVIVVQTEAAREQTVTEIVELSGSVLPEPNRSARITSLIPGVLDYVGPKVGDWVTTGEVVAHLQDSIQKAQLHQNHAAFSLAEANWSKAKNGARPQEIEQAKAALEVARANALNARQNNERMHKLFQEEISAGRDYDLAVSQERVAQSQLKSAEANLSMVLRGPRPEDKEAVKAQADQAQGMLEQSEATLTLTQLKSPINGVVAERYLDVGDQAGPATPALLVVDPTIVYVQANLPVGYNDRLAPGQAVDIILPQGTGQLTLVGHLLKVGMKLDPVTNSVPVQIEVPNAHLKLKFGMVVKARITIDKHPALVIPKASLIGSADDPHRQVVNQISGTSSKVTVVETGIVDGDLVEIKKGLRSGDRVAVDVNYELPDGTKVSVKEKPDRPPARANEAAVK